MAKFHLTAIDMDSRNIMLDQDTDCIICASSDSDDADNVHCLVLMQGKGALLRDCIDAIPKILTDICRIDDHLGWYVVNRLSGWIIKQGEELLQHEN